MTIFPKRRVRHREASGARGALAGELTTIMTKGERRARDSPRENRQKAAASGPPRSGQKAVETKAMINSTLDVQDH